VSRPEGAHLLDVNVLVALTWPDHVHHEAAQRWFARLEGSTWTTTPATESGFVRVSLHPIVTQRAVSWSGALDMLVTIRRTPAHRWWPGEIDLPASPLARRAPVVGHNQVGDVHLAALAAHHGGRLATLDRSVSDALHADDKAILVLIPPG
jgi:toxin-antitoxin system PIN domain toxin